MIHVLKNSGLKRDAQAFFEHEAAGGVVLMAPVVLAGIGFTMRLFIGTLAFHGPEAGASVRAGVLAGSVTSALVGYLVLHAALTAEQRENRHSDPDYSIAP